MQTVQLFMACAFVTALTGCATVQPTKWFVRRGPTYNTTMPSVDRVGIVVDAAVAYDRVDTNYFVVEDSLIAISNLVREATADLKAKGYEVAFIEFPFIGAFKAADTSFPVAEKRKEQPANRQSPFKTADEINMDPGYREALLKTMRNVLGAVGNRGELPTDQLRSDSGTREALAAIADKRGVRYLFVVHGSGTIVSGGKQTGQAVGTALLTGVITLGNVVVVAHNVSSLDSFVSLIDLRNAEILWCNSLALPKLNAADTADYKGRWAHNVLYWLPPRGHLEPLPPK